MRSAGRPTTTPRAVAMRAASTGAMGNGTPQLSVSVLSEKPATPASVSWANDTWPAIPVMTTIDRAMIPKMNDVTSAARNEPSRANTEDRTGSGADDGRADEVLGPRRPGQRGAGDGAARRERLRPDHEARA